MQDASIAAEGLVVERNGKIILDNLNFRISPGKLTGLIGPSGSGKTTLIRSIVGAQKISGGSLAVLGLPAGDKKLRPQIGYVTQDPAVYGDLTVAQNLKYFAVILGVGSEAISRVLEQVDLRDQTDQIVDTLSGGQRARVSLAVALLGDAQLLVFDEPTVGLDPLLRKNLWEMFRTLARSGRTLLISSHVMDEAEKCDDLLLLRDGKILSFSAKHELLRKTVTHNVEAAFLKLVEGPTGSRTRKKELADAP
jgi:ABC-2 type transport system ATP-binding protein